MEKKWGKKESHTRVHGIGIMYSVCYSQTIISLSFVLFLKRFINNIYKYTVYIVYKLQLN